MDEVAARAVGAEADGVVGSAPLRLVLGVAGEVSQFMHAVRKLALVAIFAMSTLLERPAQLRLVARRVDATTTAAVAVEPVLTVAVAAIQLSFRVLLFATVVSRPRKSRGRGGERAIAVIQRRRPGSRAGGTRQVAVPGLL